MNSRQKKAQPKIAGCLNHRDSEQTADQVKSTVREVHHVHQAEYQSQSTCHKVK
jgi:hypothetical protein